MLDGRSLRTKKAEIASAHPAPATPLSKLPPASTDCNETEFGLALHRATTPRQHLCYYGLGCALGAVPACGFWVPAGGIDIPPECGLGVPAGGMLMLPCCISEPIPIPPCGLAPIEFVNEPAEKHVTRPLCAIRNSAGQGKLLSSAAALPCAPSDGCDCTEYSLPSELPATAIVIPGKS